MRPPLAGRPQKGFYYGWVIAGIFSLLMAASFGVAMGAFGAFVNPLTTEMSWSRTAVSGAFSVHIVVNFILGVFWGWVADRWSIRWTVAISGLLLGLGFFLSSTATSLWQLYLFYGFIAGVGLGGTSAPLTAMVARWFERRTGLAIGIGYAGAGVGTAIIPVLAERLISTSGWQSAFRGVAYIIWAAFLVGIVLLKSPRRPAAPVAREAVAASPSSEAMDSSAASSSQLAIPLSGAIRTRNFWIMFGMEITGTLVLFLVLIHLIPAAIDKRNSSSSAATLLSVVGLIGIVGILGGGALGDRVGPRRVFAVAMLIIALTLVWLAFASSLWMFFIFAILFGLVNGSWYSQVPSISSRLYGTRYIGVIVGALFLGSGIGGLVGPTMAGYIFDVTGSYRIAFLLGAGFSLLGMTLALLVVEPPRRREASTIETTAG